MPHFSGSRLVSLNISPFKSFPIVFFRSTTADLHSKNDFQIIFYLHQIMSNSLDCSADTMKAKGIEGCLKKKVLKFGHSEK